MEILKNDKEAFLVFAMQGEANISNIKFKIKLNDLNIDNSFDIQNLLTIIQFEDDYLTNIPDTNINLEIKDDDLIINWLIGKAMTLEAKEREFQVIIKNKKTAEIFKSYKSIFKVQKSIDSENEDPDCNTTCIAGMLEQWNLKMQQIVDTGGNADLSEYAKLSEIAENYYNKGEIDNKIEPLITKQEVTTTLEPYSLKSEVDSKTENLQSKTDELLETTDKTIVGAINELKDSSDTISSELSNKADISSVESKQDKEDNSLETTSKTIVGAINELAKNTAPDLSNYYQKSETYSKTEVDTKLDTKLDKSTYTSDKATFQLKQDNSLSTTDKTIVGAINEIKGSIPEGADLSNYYQKSEVDSKLAEKLNTSTYNSDKDTFQLKNDASFTTTEKTVTGAINELKSSYDSLNSELSNKADASSLNNKQDKNDDALETNDKTIVGAINEVNTLAKNAATPDLSNYYQKSETYSQAEVNSKLDAKLDKSIYDSDKATFQLKEDSSLETTAKNIIGAINELNTNKIALTNLSGVQGINYSSSNGQISANVDNKSIRVNESGQLESIGGNEGNIFKSSNEVATIGEALTLNYFNKSNNYWSGENFPYTHTGNASNNDRSYLVLKVDKSNLDSSCSVLRVKTRINGLTIVGTTTKKVYVNVYVRTGGEFTAPTTFSNYLSQEFTATFINETPGGINTNDNDKEFYVFIPDIDNNDIFIDVLASEDATSTLESIEVTQVLNSKPNLVMYNNGNVIPFKSGVNSSIYIGNGGLVEKTKGNANVSYGINALKLASVIDGKTLSRSVAIGYNSGKNLYDGASNTLVGSESAQYLEKGNYNIVIGNFASENTSASVAPNYDYIKEMTQSIIIGDYTKPKTNAPNNENIIGYLANGNGNNTFTLGNNKITALYAQVTSITQFSDLRVKEDIKDANIEEVIASIKGLRIIHAGYKDLEEFIGNNENDKHKLMFDGTTYRKSFENDTRLVDRVFHPIDPITKERKTKTIETFDDQGQPITKEVDEILVIDDCIEITHNQLLPALVATNQYLLNEVESLKNTIKEQTELINRILSRIEALENK